MNSEHIAALTLEAWRSSGARTEQRRATLLDFYARSYYGTPDRWNDDVRALVDRARLILRQRTRIDELEYQTNGL